MSADEGYGRYGVNAELASVIAEGAFDDLEAPVKLNRSDARPIPFSSARRCNRAH
jgi:pyruvate/2-oxoglutarate/acetoin dehydrogenase E1 component